MALVQKDKDIISILNLEIKKIHRSNRELSTLFNLFENINKEQFH
ncbi:MAG: hypothetical protein QXL02_02580 [Candidatus Anstonellales archaeon]